jgi:hypothetical protein
MSLVQMAARSRQCETYIKLTPLHGVFSWACVKKASDIAECVRLGKKRDKIAL